MIDVIQEIQCLLAVGRIERRFVQAGLPAAEETAAVENGLASAERRRREIRFGSLGQCHMALANDGGLRETELHGAFRERRVLGQRIRRRRDARPRAIAFPLPEKMKFCVFFQNEREETGVIGRVFRKRQRDGERGLRVFRNANREAFSGKGGGKQRGRGPGESFRRILRAFCDECFL